MSPFRCVRAVLPLVLPLLTTSCLGSLLGLDQGGGTSATSTMARSPVRVGNVALVSLSAGILHNCAVAAGGAGYCWGDNSYGQLGIGSTSRRAAPTAVTGGLTFRVVSVAKGSLMTCGVATDSLAYCWGLNDRGQLGIGSTDASAHSAPLAVTGGLRFGSTVVGGTSACGITRGGAAYCWGDNGQGELGDSTGTGSNVPVAVAGSHVFVSLSAGAFHHCGVTDAGEAYCWGIGWNGELGVGTPPDGCFGHGCALA